MRTMAMAGFILFAAGAVHAAPFCLSIPGKPLQCTYFDGVVCNRDSGQEKNGACVPNPDNGKLPIDQNQIGSYCMIIATGFQQCGYSDVHTCADAAQRNHGICAKSDGTKDTPDPYTNITLDHLNRQ